MIKWFKDNSGKLDGLKLTQHLGQKLGLISVTAAIVFVAYMLQVNFVVPLFLFVMFAYLSAQDIVFTKSNLLHLSLLFVIFFVSGYLLILHGFTLAYLPFAALPMLAVILFNNLSAAFFLTTVAAIAISSLTGEFLYYGVVMFIGGISGAVLVKCARRRAVVIRSGIAVGVLQAVAFFVANKFSVKTPETYFIFFINGALSGVIILGILPIFEYLFKTVTNISLLELADFDQPLLKRMILEAPGTYHHSLVVGNLSEAACSAVGANALLARIGAYYHDVGKIEKAEYFSENQMPNQSMHDKLSPAMSKLIIMNHVKEGVELAHKYNLNPRIIDFISSHHGCSLVYYFYRRALENIEEDEEVKEEGFRYPGPKPNTKESAIVLLADSVEAATRALKESAPAKITEVVHKIINNKFIDGQLDECSLTLKDLEKISAVFIRLLSAIYHSRVSYPDKA